MTRWISVAVTAGVLAALVTAGPGPGTPEQRARRLERNRDLVQTLVRGGIHLAARADPLDRAACCNGVAADLAAAMGRAADEREPFRAAEIGRHLTALLEDGVAFNLGAAVDATPRGSRREKLIWEVRDRSADVLRPLEDLLDRSLAGQPAGPPTDSRQAELIRALVLVRAGRARVDQALSSRGLRPPARQPPKAEAD